MPVLNDASMSQQSLPNGHYGYSAARIEDLGAAEYTLVTIVTDVSPSVETFLREMEAALAQIVGACKLSPRADNLLLRLVTFASDLVETHGYKLLDGCKPADYKGVLRSRGSTALYDAALNAVDAATNFAAQLSQADFAVNGIVFVLTDGMDNASRARVEDVRDALARATRTEVMESMLSILIGVNVQDKNVGDYLKNLKTNAGFSQYIELNRADAGTLANLADFVSRSISSQSQSLGQGRPSQVLVF